MQFAAGAPTRWVLTLNDGNTVEVWADSAEGFAGSEDRRDYTFCTLMDIDEDQQGDFEIIGRPPTNPRRVIVAVARFPRAAVRDTWSS